VSFLSTNTPFVATPVTLTIAEGMSSAAFSLPTGGLALLAPLSLQIYATDGVTSKYAPLTLTPVVNLAVISGNPVEGGFPTYGSVSLSIPAQAGGAVVSLTSGDPSLLTLPASVTIPQGYMTYSFNINTGGVTALTNVPMTATFNGASVTGSVALNAAPVISLASLVVPEVVGGKTVTGTVTLNNFSRSISGSVINLSSGDTGTLQVPATVTVPYGAYSASFTATTNVVSGLKGVSVKASYNGANLTTTTNVNPIPTVTILSADWDPTTLLLKIKADTSYANSILTYGTDTSNGPIGTMQLELGIWNGSILMATAPTTAIVWNSNGGQASFPVTNKGIKISGGSTGGGGGGGGGSTSTSSTYKISISTTGKGTVTTNPTGTTFAAGTSVTLTATPAAGSPWVGWSGGVTSKSQTITVTVNANLSLTANFK
jgi:hypothetical protein